MKLRFLFPGRTREKFLAEGLAFYFKRLRPLVEAENLVLKGATLPPAASPGDEEAARAKEAAAILARVRPQETLVTLDVAGRLCSSEELAAFFSRKKNEGAGVVNLALGGPWGVHASLTARADLCLSLSPMTFTHELARLILLEQVYRAFSILAGSPYHK